MNAIRIQPLRGRMIFAVLTLGLAGLHGAVTAVLLLTRSTFVGESWVEAFLLLATGLAFVAWLFDARVNLDGVEPRLRWHPIWSYAGWFIPVASLVISLLVVREIDRATQRLANGSDRPGLFTAWAVSFTAYQILLFIPGGRAVGVVLAVVQVVAAIAAILLVRRITAEQQIAASPHLLATVRPRRPGGTER
jgi:hypothetical protein